MVGYVLEEIEKRRESLVGQIGFGQDAIGRGQYAYLPTYYVDTQKVHCYMCWQGRRSGLVVILSSIANDKKLRFGMGI